MLLSSLLLYILCHYPFIYSLLYLIPSRWPREKSLHLSLSKHFFLANLIPPLLSITLSCMYSTLSFYLTTGLPLLLSATLSSQTPLFFLSILPNHFKVFFLPIPICHTSLHLHKVPCHIFHTHFHCSRPPILSCTCSSKIANFHTTHS